MTSDRLAGYSRLMATLTLLLIAGMLLLNAGKVLNLALIEKLIAFEAIEGARYTLFVRLPESTT